MFSWKFYANQVIFWGGSVKRLFAAVYDGDIEKVREYLAAGDDPNEKSDPSDEPSLFAINIKKKHAFDCLLELLNAGADVNATNRDGLTPLQYILVSAKHDYVFDDNRHELEHEKILPLIKILIASRADVDAYYLGSGPNNCPQRLFNTALEFKTPVLYIRKFLLMHNSQIDKECAEEIEYSRTNCIELTEKEKEIVYDTEKKLAERNAIPPEGVFNGPCNIR